VLWSEDGGGTRPGRLDVFADRLLLAGGSRSEPTEREIAVAAIGLVRIGRLADDRLGGRATLVLELRDGGGVVRIAGFSPVGALHELAERLWALTSPQE
jgi:hypothetical protein